MNKQKITICLLICFFALSFLYIPSASAVTLIDELTGGVGSVVAIDGPTRVATGGGQSFTPNADYTLTVVNFNLVRYGSPTGALQCVILNSTDYTVMAGAIGTINVAQVSTGGGIYSSSFGSGFILRSGVTYIAALIISGTSAGFTQTNCIQMWGSIDSGAPNAAGVAYTRSTVGVWSVSGANHDIDFAVYGNAYTAPAEPTTYGYVWNLSPLPTYNYFAWGTSAVTTQTFNYTYTGQFTNNTNPTGTGTFSYYKTASFNGGDGDLITDANDALTAGSVTLNGTGTVTNGQVIFYLLSPYVSGSTLTYQGIKVNGTIDGQAFTSQFVLTASEPDMIFLGTLSGGHFGTVSPAFIALSPTLVYLQQRANYVYDGYCYVNNLLTGSGTFTTYSTGLSSDGTILNGPFNEIASGSVTNGHFSFVLASRQANQAVYEGYKVEVVLNDGKNYTATYRFAWQVDVWTATPIPGDTDGDGDVDADDNSDFPINSSDMMARINFIILFVIIGGPAFLLGVKAGLPGLIVGASLGLCLGVMANLIPFYMLFLVGAGLVSSFLMWRRNNGQ